MLGHSDSGLSRRYFLPGHCGSRSSGYVPDWRWGDSGNEGRNYCCGYPAAGPRHGRILGFPSFLSEIAEVVIDTLVTHYVE